MPYFRSRSPGPWAVIVVQFVQFLAVKIAMAFEVFSSRSIFLFKPKSFFSVLEPKVLFTKI
jgi:hypothetical protein